MASKASRKKAYKRGVWSENLAALLLMVKGYGIVGRRQRTAVGEIDLIARRGAVLAFVEVKARATRADAAASLGAIQRQRIERAAAAWCAHRPWTTALSWRFDVVWVGRAGLPKHIPDAWRPDT